MSLAGSELLGALFAGYAAMSAVTFVAYAVDKRAARRGTRRTPEATLILLGFLGGWPGALLAQQLLRHKTIKRSFQTVFWLSVVANLVVVGAFGAVTRATIG